MRGHYLCFHREIRKMFFCSSNSLLSRPMITLIQRILFIISKKEFSFTVTVWVLIENYHQTVTMTYVGRFLIHKQYL